MNTTTETRPARNTDPTDEVTIGDLAPGDVIERPHFRYAVTVATIERVSPRSTKLVVTYTDGDSWTNAPGYTIRRISSAAPVVALHDKADNLGVPFASYDIEPNRHCTVTCGVCGEKFTAPDHKAATRKYAQHYVDAAATEQVA